MTFSKRVSMLLKTKKEPNTTDSLVPRATFKHFVKFQVVIYRSIYFPHITTAGDVLWAGRPEAPEPRE
jgi:hypothetical protein